MDFDKGSGGGEPPDGGDRPRGALTRQEIALALHRRLGNISHREAKRLTDCVIEEMVETLAAGETLKLHDFGSFVVRSKQERAGRNPRTGDPAPIQARRVVVFKAAPNMKAAVDGKAPAGDKPAQKAKSPKDDSGGAFGNSGSRARSGDARDASTKTRQAGPG